MVKIYVDGSYNDSRKLTGWGFVVVKDGTLIHKNSGVITDEDVTAMHQVGGELMASMEAIWYCKCNSLKDVTIVYDYKGVEDWVTGAWKCKKKVTQCYKEYMNLAKQFVNYKFEKVKSHSGDKYNDMADKLAKSACGVI